MSNAFPYSKVPFFRFFAAKKHRPDLLRTVLYILFSSGLLFQRLLPLARLAGGLGQRLPGGGDVPQALGHYLLAVRRIFSANS